MKVNMQIKYCSTILYYTLHTFDPSLCIHTARGLNLA